MRKYLSLLLLAFSLPALAHPGHGADSFHAGFFHPLTGLDHLLMLAGAGVLSALSGRKLLLPFATLGMMLVGAIAGSLLGGFSGMEMLIIASLGVCGVMMFKSAAGGACPGDVPRLGARGGDVRPQLLALHQRLYAGQRHGAVRQLRRRVTAAPPRRTA